VNQRATIFRLTGQRRFLCAGRISLIPGGWGSWGVSVGLNLLLLDAVFSTRLMIICSISRAARTDAASAGYSFLSLRIRRKTLFVPQRGTAVFLRTFRNQPRSSFNCLCARDCDDSMPSLGCDLFASRLR
jgi:hypothetical protein